MNHPRGAANRANASAVAGPPGRQQAFQRTGSSSKNVMVAGTANSNYDDLSTTSKHSQNNQTQSRPNAGAGGRQTAGVNGRRRPSRQSN